MHLDLTRNQVEEEALCGCATSKSLFIYFIFNCMERKGKLLFRKIFKKKSGIGYEVARSKVLNYARKKNEGDLVISTEFIKPRVEQSSIVSGLPIIKSD